MVSRLKCMHVAVGHVSSSYLSLWSHNKFQLKFSTPQSDLLYTEYLKLFTWLRCRLCLTNANKSCTQPYVMLFSRRCKCRILFSSNNNNNILNSYSEIIFFGIEINAVRWSHQPHSWFGDIFDYPDCVYVYVICEQHANCVFIQHVNKIKIWFTNVPAKWFSLTL